MSATITVDYRKATITNYKWSSDDKYLEKLLNTMLPLQVGGDPNPEYTAAKMAVDELGGKITKYDIYKSEKGVVY